MKTCKACAVEKPYSAFYLNKTHKDGYAGTCKACKKAQHLARVSADPSTFRKRAVSWGLKHRFGITPDRREELLRDAGGRCQICEARLLIPVSASGPSDMNIDHDHNTGAIRGVLCGPCNRGIGLLRDSPTLLRKAAEYLTR